jgi:hypothetical protein
VEARSIQELDEQQQCEPASMTLGVGDLCRPWRCSALQCAQFEISIIERKQAGIGMALARGGSRDLGSDEEVQTDFASSYSMTLGNHHQRARQVFT